MLWIVAALVLSVLLAALTKPNEFRVSRQAVINASPDVIFPLMNNIETGQKWSPWVEMDPNADYKMEGPTEGVGAKLSWEGKKAGKGQLTVTESRPNELIRMHLEFFKPMKGTNTAEYILTPQNGGTLVTWNMYGPNHLLGKIVSVFMNCEKMCATQFDKGLSNLKGMAEA